MTSGLERLSNLLSKKDSVFVSDLLREAKVNELDETLSTTRLNHLIDKGYERITLQLDLGGESPGYLEKDKHYREAGNDSNLLIVFYVQIMPDDFVMQLHRF
ncbi:TRAP transporter subunit DctM [Escherichia coli]|nr:TRAP transporter subunit DctM [Escherichia coli]CTX06271.1 TRAP transporter subunit DctM [Escherichia coli]CTZ88005.1 TRAP transporter subunit DctM [Escherichia coli]CTZ94049.1 TRAP transporter subunit DctM [Escherichia coli]